MREIQGAVVAALLLVLSAASSSTAVAQDDGGARPSIESCESVFRAEPIDGDEADKRRAGSLIARLRDPEASYELSFRSRNTRHGAIYGDGEQLDTDVPALFLDSVGDALVDGSDHLAFIASRESRWSFAEMRRDGMRRTRFAQAEQFWGNKGVGGPGPVRLPDAMARTKAATPVTTPTGLDGHWYEVTMSADLGPGLMWDSTREVFEIIRDVDARLLIDVDDDGMPMLACLWQAWWQGEVIEEFVVGEDASLASAIRIEHMGSAPALPPESWPVVPTRADELDIEVPVPQGGEAGTRDGVFMAWLDDEDLLPRLRVERRRFMDEALEILRELPLEHALEILAQEDETSARLGWGVDPLTVESARIGGADGGPSAPARLLTFQPTLDDGVTYLAIDIVTFVDPWKYHFQLLAPIEDNVASRYLLERTLEGTRFLCSPGDGGACPAEQARP